MGFKNLLTTMMWLLNNQPTPISHYHKNYDYSQTSSIRSQVTASQRCLYKGEATVLREFGNLLMPEIFVTTSPTPVRQYGPWGRQLGDNAQARNEIGQSLLFFAFLGNDFSVTFNSQRIFLHRLISFHLENTQKGREGSPRH